MDMTNVEDIYTLSHVQEAMLLEGLQSPNSGKYLGHSVCTVQGLNVTALAEAWQQVVKRHQMLRTSFAWARADKAVQVVHKQLDYNPNEQDWRGLPDAEQQDRLEKLITYDQANGFDPSVAPLTRLTVCRTADDTYQIVLSYHHLVLDSWSLPLILKEIAAIYGEYSNGRSINLAPPQPYKKFIGWLKQQDKAAALAFWKQSLQGFVGPASLNLAGRRESREPCAGVGTDRLMVPPSIAEQVKALELTHQVNAKTVVLGAWAVLLSRYSDSADMVFGVGVSGRPTELEGAELI